jgi:cytochrome c oxidase subunit 2
MLDRTHRLRRAALVAAAGLAVVVLASCGERTGPDNEQNALRPAGPDARKILDLTQPFFWIAVVIGAFVLFGTIYVAVRFRARPGDDEAPKQVHGNTILEVGWTIVPALILAVMAVPTVATIFDLAKDPTDPNTLRVTVTARQWWWQFHYDDASNIETANELHIPAGTPVVLTLQGPPPCSGENCYDNGVIHSFWVPELGGKKDVVPGRSHFLRLEADEPGTYLGQCAEYCGLAHADMRVRVVAHTPAEFRAWQQRQQEPLRPAVAAKFDEYNQQYGCLACHSAEPTKPGAAGPNLTHLGDRIGLAADKYRLTFDNLWKWVWDAPGRKPTGEFGQRMPSFKDRMTQDQAKEIACFLLTETATQPTTHPECPS